MTSFVAQNWGNVASVAGLIVSVWVLFVAKNAKKAAEEARSAARLKSLVEVLEDASDKHRQVGLYLRARDWNALHLLAQEVSDRCWQVSARWGDHLAPARKSNLMEAARIAGSLASFAATASMRQLDEEQLRRASDSYQDASKLISIVLGEAQKVEERIKE